MNAREFRPHERDSFIWWGEMFFYPVWWAGFSCFCGALLAIPLFFVAMIFYRQLGNLPDEAMPYIAWAWLGLFVVIGIFRARRRAMGWRFNRLIINDAGLEYLCWPKPWRVVPWDDVKSAHLTIDDEDSAIDLTVRTTRKKIALCGEDWPVSAIHQAMSERIPDRTTPARS